MNNVDYTPNSHKFKSEQKAASEQPKVKKVVQGKRTKNEARKMREIIAPGDMKNIGDYILMDILVPSAKKFLSEAGRVFIDMLIYGDSGRDRRGSAPYDRVSYNNYGSYSSGNNQNNGTRTRTVFAYDDVVVPSRYDAENVIRTLEDIIATYQMVSVATFYEVCQVPDNNFMNHKYGWMNVKNAEIIPVRDGWKIKMPKAMPLDN